jgi:hypothetical protein
MNPLAGESGDHLVDVRVRGGSRPGLKDVDGELVVVLPGGDRVAGGGNAFADVALELAELGVGARRGGLDAAEPVDDGGRDLLT